MLYLDFQVVDLSQSFSACSLFHHRSYRLLHSIQANLTMSLFVLAVFFPLFFNFFYFLAPIKETG